MTESESVALPLGDTPISSYQYILADIADYIKHFLYLFQKFLMRAAPEGEAAGAKTRRRRPKAGQRRPKAGRRGRRQDDSAQRRNGGSEDKAAAPENRAAAPEGETTVPKGGATVPENEEAAPEGGRRHRRQGDGSKTGRRVAFRLRVGEAVVQEDGAAIAFYIFFKNFFIPRKRRGEHPAF